MTPALMIVTSYVFVAGWLAAAILKNVGDEFKKQSDAFAKTLSYPWRFFVIWLVMFLIVLSWPGILIWFIMRENRR